MYGKSKYKIAFFIILVPFLILAYGWVVMSLWNWLMPDITGVTEITFWESLGLIALFKLLIALLA